MHYHSRTHEVLGIARGVASILLGGQAGRILRVKAGDVIVLPAGTGHKRLAASGDLLVVGAYPVADEYDECRESKEEHDRAIPKITAIGVPKKDPVYGNEDPLIAIWNRRGRRKAQN